MSPIVGDVATAEHLSELFQNVAAPNRLDNREFRLHLPAESSRPVSKDGAAKATLTINETGNPSAVPESFLLVFRTHRIFTPLHGSTLQIACNTGPC